MSGCQRGALMKETNTTYSLRYVAFLDLLGFKTLVDQSDSNQEILDKINLALEYTAGIRQDNYEGAMSLAKIDKHVTVFSDSIVISYATTMPGGGFQVLMDLVYICNDLLGIGIQVRGGVTVGKLIHDESKCFGPAMVDAYLMESEKAKYPRVIIDKKVLEYDLRRPGEANTVEYEMGYLSDIVSVDSKDGEVFLDYLKQRNEFDEIEIYDDYIKRTRRFIKDNLKLYAENKKVKSKYKWLKRYYNQTVTAVYGGKAEKLLI